MNPDWAAKTRRILVVGPSGSGKSSWLEVFLRGWSGSIFAFDQKGELAIRSALPVCGTPADIAPALARGAAAFNPHGVYEGRMTDAFDFWCRVAMAAAKARPGEKLFVCDELQDFVSHAPGGLPAALASILESGRGWHLHSVCLAQASNLVNARLRQQFSEVVAFRQTEPRARDFLRAVGFPEDFPDLPPLAFVHLNRDTGALRRGAVRFRAGRAELTSGR